MLIFVDCEADGGEGRENEERGLPALHRLTEIGAVAWKGRQTFYADLRKEDRVAVFMRFEAWLKEVCGKERPIFVSDNPAYDWQWINDGFWRSIGRNPFGHSARRIGDFFAGLSRDFYKSNAWKHLRRTKHDHNPVNDAMGNVEAFERMLAGER